MRLCFKGILALGGDTQWVFFPHFHFEGRHIGFCFLNVKLLVSFVDPLDMVSTMLNVQIIHNPLPTESDN
jgi:hypothetical protein